MDRRKITRVLAVLAASAVLLFGFLVAQRLADYYKDSDVVQTSQEDSFYVGDLTLELTTRGGYPVYYSTDGSVPSTENSALYSGPLVFESGDQVQSVTVRARYGMSMWPVRNISLICRLSQLILPREEEHGNVLLILRS